MFSPIWKRCDNDFEIGQLFNDADNYVCFVNLEEDEPVAKAEMLSYCGHLLRLKKEKIYIFENIWNYKNMQKYEEKVSKNMNIGYGKRDFGTLWPLDQAEKFLHCLMTRLQSERTDSKWFEKFGKGVSHQTLTVASRVAWLRRIHSRIRPDRNVPT